MNITYNNIQAPEGLVTLTEIPNILKIEDYIDGTRAAISFSFSGDLQSQVVSEGQYYITFLGDTITNTLNPSNSNNKRFYISDVNSTAMSVTRAFRSCPNVSVDFNVLHDGNVVTLISKTIGSKWDNIQDVMMRNIPSDYLTVAPTNGTSSGDCFNSKIDVDVYSNSAATSGSYITTLEKNFYGGSCSFDVSPVLSTFSQYGKSKRYMFDINLIKEDGTWQNLGNVSGNTVIGYQANMSDKYIYGYGAYMLRNSSRGYEGIFLYTYSNVINYSVLVGENNSTWGETYSVKNAANVEIYNSGMQTRRKPLNDMSNLIVDESVTIPIAKFSQGTYVDITVGGSTTRYRIIKPLKATEYFQRVLWRNEYGGISFFDFTGQRSESDSIDIETYEKNVFDYHERDDYERKMIYKNGFSKSVTLQSHLLEKNGKFLFDSLMKSKKVWTTIDEVRMYIIPKSISVEEDQAYNDIYRVKLTYQYSDE